MSYPAQNAFDKIINTPLPPSSNKEISSDKAAASREDKKAPGCSDLLVDVGTEADIAGTVGEAPSFIIIDDPVNPKIAASQEQLVKASAWMSSTLSTRLSAAARLDALIIDTGEDLSLKQKALEATFDRIAIPRTPVIPAGRYGLPPYVNAEALKTIATDEPDKVPLNGYGHFAINPLRVRWGSNEQVPNYPDRPEVIGPDLMVEALARQVAELKTRRDRVINYICSKAIGMSLREAIEAERIEIFMPPGAGLKTVYFALDYRKARLFELATFMPYSKDPVLVDDVYTITAGFTFTHCLDEIIDESKIDY